MLKLEKRLINATDSAVQEFRTRVRGELILSGDSHYDEARKIWNGMIDRHPAMILRCAGVSDVMAAVRFAAENGLPLAVRGGGHNVAGNALCDDGLVIDFSRMKSIRVDPAMRTARAEPGVLWGEFDHETQAFGLAVTGGLVSTTGISGFTLGGGIGWLVRKLGLTIDNLISADMVTADGRLLTASEKENPDLFWAIRGGGGNFGVITSLEYRLHQVGPIVLAGMALYKMEKAGEAVRFFRDYTKSLPDELTTMAAFLKAPPAPFIPSQFHGAPMYGVVLCYAGDVDEGVKVLEPLRSYGPPDIDLIQPMPYTALQKILDAIEEPGVQNYWKSHYLSSLADGAMDTIIEFAGRTHSPLTHIDVHDLKGAFGRVSNDSTAFVSRDANYVINIVSTWTDPADNDRNVKWTRDLFDALSPYATGGAYLNFMDRHDEGRIRSAYGGNYERLVELKRKYDPTNLFHHNQNIKP
jgi:FAD/FMN-containing dehydrogenase